MGPFKVWSCMQAILFMLVKRRVGGAVSYWGTEPNSWLILELLERKKRKVCLSLESLFSQKYLDKKLISCGNQLCFDIKCLIVQKQRNSEDFLFFFLHVKSYSQHFFSHTYTGTSFFCTMLLHRKIIENVMR